ncbi:Uncharacterised protein [Mycobacteroides abscessus subsp. abscessus]|nr:Uncharacterised protein [Mycobacteroides abscessus subsp. abscessus]
MRDSGSESSMRSRSMTGRRATSMPTGDAAHCSAVRAAAATPPAATTASSRATEFHVRAACAMCSFVGGQSRTEQTASRWCGKVVIKNVQPSAVR